MVRLAIAAILALCCLPAWSQQDPAWAKRVNDFWASQDIRFKDPRSTPLPPEDLKTFKTIDRYAPDARYRVTARFTSRQGPDFVMPTTGPKQPIYRSIGYLSFTVDGRSCRLNVYQNQDALKDPRYADHLFVPFTDLSNGESTYGGGRYIDLSGPLGASVELDFNVAYNPLCAYGTGYSCPIPPKENHLKVPIHAGARYKGH